MYKTKMIIGVGKSVTSKGGEHTALSLLLGRAFRENYDESIECRVSTELESVQGLKNI